MFEQDYIMRLIHEMVRAVMKLVFGLDEEDEEEVKLLDTLALTTTASDCHTTAFVTWDSVLTTFLTYRSM